MIFDVTRDYTLNYLVPGLHCYVIAKHILLQNCLNEHLIIEMSHGWQLKFHEDPLNIYNYLTMNHMLLP
jgi:hypothetical protein